MAVIGRQNSKKYFASQQAISASAMDRFSRANSRALSDKLTSYPAARSIAARFQRYVAVVEFQKKQASVSSMLRSALRGAPHLFGFAVVREIQGTAKRGWPEGAKLVWRFDAPGSHGGELRGRAGANPGGVGRQRPGSSPPT